MRQNNAVAKEAFRVVADFVKSPPHVSNGLVDLFEDERGDFARYTFHALENPYSVGDQVYADWQQPGYGSNANTITNAHSQGFEEQQFIVDDFRSDPIFYSGSLQGSAVYGSLFVTCFDQLNTIAEYEAAHVPGKSD
ncbi:unnamed protein product [Periconia digitata]|uniref:Uncharacterized protein n=1 Tax=Periconia digitata TaxID=1303443 RepID=A0A9W4XN79_9PLEO|nr:unnamed protein product [Periconia digitata]